MSLYQPPMTITPTILNLVEHIGETLGRWSISTDNELSPKLRRINRIRTIQASLAIENNSLSVEQVTAVIDGKRVLGLPREIQEVRNALNAYEHLPQWQPTDINDLLSAHGLLMAGLLDVETVIREQQDGYYQALADADQMADSAPFVSFMLQALLTAMSETTLTDPVSDPVSDPVNLLLAVFQTDEALKIGDLLDRLGLQHRPTFRKNYLRPALKGGWIEMTQPQSPNSPMQKYRLSEKGKKSERQSLS